MADTSIIHKITALLENVLAEMPDVFLVQVKLKATDNIKVYVDTDAGISIDTCIRINRKLYALLVEQGMYEEGAFALEVSSPGIGEPILLERQYLKNMGRWLVVHTITEAKLEGTLKEITASGIVLEEVKGKGKKQELLNHTIVWGDIKKAVVEVKL